MIDTIKSHLRTQLKEIEESGLYKRERIITSPQQARINVETGETVLNMCANNYLGLSNHPAIIEAAKRRHRPMGAWALVCALYLRDAVHSQNAGR